MLKMAVAAAALCLASQSVYCNQLPVQEEKMETTPQFLYKILDADDWKTSQKAEALLLPAADAEFIHFSREDQLERILAKYWANSPAYVVLKIDTAKLPGQMVFEANPGGSSKYYHLYGGSIPLDAVAESKLISK